MVREKKLITTKISIFNLYHKIVNRMIAQKNGNCNYALPQYRVYRPIVLISKNLFWSAIRSCLSSIWPKKLLHIKITFDNRTPCYIHFRLQCLWEYLFNDFTVACISCPKKPTMTVFLFQTRVWMVFCAPTNKP